MWTAPVVLRSVPAYASVCSGAVTLTAAPFAPGNATASFDVFDAYAFIRVCSSGGAATSLGATATVGESTTELALLVVGMWPSAAEPNGTDTLTVTAPAEETIPAGTCQDYTVHFQWVEWDDDSSMTVTFTSACGGEGSVVIRKSDYGQG